MAIYNEAGKDSVMVAFANTCPGIKEIYDVDKIDYRRVSQKCSNGYSGIDNIIVLMKKEDNMRGLDSLNPYVTEDMLSLESIVTNRYPVIFDEDDIDKPDFKVMLDKAMRKIINFKADNVKNSDIVITVDMDTDKVPPANEKLTTMTPAELLFYGYASDPESAVSLAEEIKKNPSVVGNLENIKNNVQKKIKEVAFATPMDVYPNANGHIADTTTPSGVLDFSVFGIGKIDTRNNGMNVSKAGTVIGNPAPYINMQSNNPFLDFINQQNQNSDMNMMAPVYMCNIPQQSTTTDANAPYMYPQQQPMQNSMYMIPVQQNNFAQPQNHVAQVPVVQQTQFESPVTQINVKKQKAEADKISISAPQIVEVAKDPKVVPETIQKIEKVPEQKTRISPNKNNEPFIAKYKILADVERVANENGYSLVFQELQKYNNPNEPCGIVCVFVFRNGLESVDKRFAIDTGVMYDHRIKFFPVMLPELGKFYEDYPVYSITTGGAKNEFTDRDLKSFIIGGPLALGSGMIKPELMEVNKYVDLRSMPKVLSTHVTNRREIQNRLINMMKKGVFRNALEMAPASRWRFESYDPVKKSFVLTNENCNTRFNVLCGATVKLLINADENNGVTISKINTVLMPH